MVNARTPGRRMATDDLLLSGDLVIPHLLHIHLQTDTVFVHRAHEAASCLSHSCNALSCGEGEDGDGCGDTCCIHA